MELFGRRIRLSLLMANLFKPEAISLGESGTNIGMVSGRAIETDTEIGLDTVRVEASRGKGHLGAYSKKYPT